MKKQAGKITDRAVALLYIIFLYASLPFMPGLWEKFTQKFGNLTDYFAFIVISALVVFIVFYLIAKKKAARNFVWLAILACVYIWALSRLELSIERMHFIEYGILSFFVFRALRHDIKGKFLYLFSAISVFGLGLLDEGIQYILPNRVYDTRDVVVNGLAGILGLLLIGLCVQNEKDR